jgi:hypothetical protein
MSLVTSHSYSSLLWVWYHMSKSVVSFFSPHRKKGFTIFKGGAGNVTDTSHTQETHFFISCWSSDGAIADITSLILFRFSSWWLLSTDYSFLSRLTNKNCAGSHLVNANIMPTYHFVTKNTFWTMCRIVCHVICCTVSLRKSIGSLNWTGLQKMMSAGCVIYNLKKRNGFNNCNCM